MSWSAIDTIAGASMPSEDRVVAGAGAAVCPIRLQQSSGDFTPAQAWRVFAQQACARIDARMAAKSFAAAANTSSSTVAMIFDERGSTNRFYTPARRGCRAPVFDAKGNRSQATRDNSSSEYSSLSFETIVSD